MFGGPISLYILAWFGAPVPAPATSPVVHLSRPMAPPDWALLERQVLAANAEACVLFHERYFDDRDFLECVERWGGNDGPDDAIECVADWPLLYALGADGTVFERYRRIWEGHLRQYAAARTTEVELARQGMYYREFPVQFDWVHHAEGLTAFHHEGLCDPTDERYRQRVLRFAGFYTGEDPTAPNYDPEHKIIRSLFNGSRGPLLRKATALDWAGDPIDVEHRFTPRHGERTYAEFLAHFQDYTDIVGDHPQNLCATSLVANAFLLTGAERYRGWVLDYAGGWIDRAKANGDILPTNIGLDGTIGGACGGKWYGGVYGWGFSVRVPQTGEVAHRNTHHLGLVGFGNAWLLSGDRRFLDVWRRQIRAVNAHSKTEGGATLYPRMHGDDGWYAFVPEPYAAGADRLYFWTLDPMDKALAPANGWFDFLAGADPGYPRAALKGELESIRKQVAAIHADATTPDTRLADDPLMVSPVAVGALVQLTLGGVYTGHDGSLLHARLRYFDPTLRRAGLPPDVAALVTELSPDRVGLTLVNVNPVRSRSMVVQSGAYGADQCLSVRVGESSVQVGARSFLVELGPGCGGAITIHQSRHANLPTLTFPPLP